MFFLKIAVLLVLVLTLGACSGPAVASITTSVTPPAQSTVVEPTAQPPTAVALPSASTGPTSAAVVVGQTAQPPTVAALSSASTGPTRSAVPGTAVATPPGRTVAPIVVAVTSAPMSPNATGVAQTEQPAPLAVHHVFPVRSTGKITYGPYHHDYPAADIFCPIGSEFVAVTSGVIDYVSRVDRWDPRIDDGATRGGLSIALIGDDGVRYYGSHLSQIAQGIAPGVRVTTGQLLGLTGKTGDARYTDAHLHFGISHPTTPDDWQVRRGQFSPYNYLRAWQRGEDVTPKLP